MVKHDFVDIEEVRRIDLPTATFSKLENGSIYIKYKPSDDDFDLEDAKRHSEALEKLDPKEGHHVVVDFRGVEPRFTNEAREYFARNRSHSSLRKSQALVIDGLAHRIVANFYMKFNKPDCPVKIFEKPEDAMEWSQSLD